MNAMNPADPHDEGLLALRRTLWQLAAVGIAAACVVANVAPGAQAVALWCVLAPLSALAVHFRHAIARGLHGSASEGSGARPADAQRLRYQRTLRPRQVTRRKGPMALRRRSPAVHLGVR